VPPGGVRVGGRFVVAPWVNPGTDLRPAGAGAWVGPRFTGGAGRLGRAKGAEAVGPNDLRVRFGVFARPRDGPSLPVRVGPPGTVRPTPGIVPRVIRLAIMFSLCQTARGPVMDRLRGRGLRGRGCESSLGAVPITRPPRSKMT
jgi:hypothetical protein